MATPIPCAGILLAAGASTRLGYPKQLLQLDCETLLHRAARLAYETGLSPINVVLGSKASELQPELRDLPVYVLINEDWQSGMASSLRLGLQALPLATTHAMVLVCDQVGLCVSQLGQLLQTSSMHPQSIVASSYSGSSGVPAIFPAAFFPELRMIQGDRGARDLLRRHHDNVLPLTFPQGAHDIDTAEDVQQAGLHLPDGVHIDDKTAESRKN